MAIYVVPPELRKNIGGHAGFTDAGLVGRGVPRYTRSAGYQGFDAPTPIGARYFPPQPDYDEQTDAPVPLAVTNVMEGGRPVYRQKVWNAAKKDRKKFGFSKADLDELGPDGYGPNWTAKKVA